MTLLYATIVDVIATTVCNSDDKWHIDPLYPNPRQQLISMHRYIETMSTDHVLSLRRQTLHSTPSRSIEVHAAAYECAVYATGES